MDSLILVIALVVPNLPDPRIQSVQMGFLAATTLLALVIVSLRGLF